jgi:hypothetical protein
MVVTTKNEAPRSAFFYFHFKFGGKVNVVPEQNKPHTNWQIYGAKTRRGDPCQVVRNVRFQTI